MTRADECISGRVPPQAIDIERAVLGSILVDSRILDEICDDLSPDIFYGNAHTEIYLAIKKLFDECKPIDLLSVTEQLRKNGKLDQAGHEAYLGELTENTATSTNLSYHCKILQGKSNLRQLIQTSSSNMNAAFEANANPEDVLKFAEDSIFQIRLQKKETGIESVGDLQIGFKSGIQERRKKKISIGTPIGFEDLNKATGGLQVGDYVIIGGRPSQGKTSFALAIALNAVRTHISNPAPIVIFSLETTKEKLFEKMVSELAGVEIARIRNTALLSEVEYVNVIQVSELLKSYPIFIDDTKKMTPALLRARCRKLKAQYGSIGMIFVDYIQRMSHDKRFDSRREQIEEVSRDLCETGHYLETHMIPLAQISRQGIRIDKKTGKVLPPRMEDLKEAGALEQDGDIILLIHRPEFYDPDDRPGIAEIQIAKQRDGLTGTIDLWFEKKYTRFSDLSKQQEQEQTVIDWTDF